MGLLAIDDLKPGMVLAAPVRNHQDQLLLDAGRKVMLKHIQVFKAWGIRRVDVKPGPDVPGAGLPQAENPAAPDESVRRRFADVAGDPLMAAIMLAAGRQLAARHPKTKAGHGRS
jgi:hypothetical protein